MKLIKTKLFELIIILLFFLVIGFLVLINISKSIDNRVIGIWMNPEDNQVLFEIKKDSIAYYNQKEEDSNFKLKTSNNNLFKIYYNGWVYEGNYELKDKNNLIIIDNDRTSRLIVRWCTENSGPCDKKYIFSKEKPNNNIETETVDIDPKSIEYKDEFVNSVKNDSRVSKFIYPPFSPFYHLEIPQPIK